MYAAGIAAIWWCVSRMQGATWEWLLIVPVAIAGNFGEWAMHKYVMHRKIDVFALRAIYDRHTRQHHQYFTDNEPTIDTVQEFRIVFFPWRVLIVLAVMGGLLGFIVGQLINAERGLRRLHHHDRALHGVRDLPLLLPREGQLRSCATCPSSTPIRRHHAAHHNMGIMMHCNMNLTFPIADWAMKHERPQARPASGTSSTATATRT